MEDFHGYQRFPHPNHALHAYAKSFSDKVRPSEWRELVRTGERMIGYYVDDWLPQRKAFETYWVDDVPQCEVEFEIKLPGIAATYGGTFDRIVTDDWGRLWVLDWKTAGKFDSKKWETDPQVSAYTWAAQMIYGLQFEGVVMVQFLKSPPIPPKVLKNGEVSRDKSQPTNYNLYRATLIEQFGEVPDKYFEFLEYLAKLDQEQGDPFIRWDYIRRNQAQVESEVSKLVLVGKDMLNKRLPMYPNPTRDCSWECSFRTACIMMDDGSDYEDVLNASFAKRHEITGWRKNIVWPDDPRYVEPVIEPEPEEISDEDFLSLLSAGLEEANVT